VNLVGRVYFNLAENRNDQDAPSPFLPPIRRGCRRRRKLSTFRWGRLCGVCRHRSKGPSAVTAASGAARRRRLPVVEEHDRRGRDLPSAALDGGGGDADVARCTAAGERRRGGAHAGHMERESAGSARVMARIGGNAPAKVGQDALLDFRMEVVLDGER